MVDQLVHGEDRGVLLQEVVLLDLVLHDLLELALLGVLDTRGAVLLLTVDLVDPRVALDKQADLVNLAVLQTEDQVFQVQVDVQVGLPDEDVGVHHQLF